MTDPRAVLIGTWRTRGTVLDEDGTEIAGVDGTDEYRWLGDAWVIHHVDVRIGDDAVRQLEMIGPRDPASGVHPTHAYDGLGGGTETSTARVDGEGAWRFGSHSAYAVLRVDADAGHAEATWFRVLDDGPREWMRLHFTRERD